MSETTYTGDLLLKLDTNGDWDIEYENGQPKMTDAFDTALILSVFSDPDFWQNSLTNDPAEKYISEFPAVIKSGRVDEKTKNDGIAAIQKALSWMKTSGAVERIDVTGEVLNVYGLGWQVEITKGGAVSRYLINWEKAEVEVRRA